MIGEDEEQDVDDEDEDDEDDVDVEEVEGSDEEIFSSNQHRSLSNEGIRHSGQPNFGRKNDYHLLSNNELEHKSNAVGFDTTLNAIWTPTPMSPVRRAFFLASIMFGVLVVAMFLWALPCDVQPCESELKLKPRQWFSEFDHIGVNYTQLLEKINGDLNLFISFYKIEKFSDISYKNASSASWDPKFNITPSDCGLLSLDEKTGKQSWKVDLLECPLHVKCDLLDATGDGLPDCLILGHTSMALLFEPIYGTIFWHIHVHNKEEVPLPTFDANEFHYDLPIMLQDLNFDGFSELLFPVMELSSSMEKERKKSHLVLVSGRSGAIIGKPFSILNCFKIIEIFKEDVSIGYTCSMENRSELTGKIPLATLLSEIGKDFDRDHFRNDTFDIQSSKESPEANDAVCQIRYVNKGKCPYCKTQIEFGFSVDNSFNQEYEYTSVVSWRVLSYNNACKGAVMKLWKWDPNSLQKAFQESSSSTVKMDQDSATNSPFIKDEFGFKLEPSQGENYPTIYNDNNNNNNNNNNDDLDSNFDGDKYAFTADYHEKSNGFHGVPEDDSPYPHKFQDQALSFVTRNRHNRNSLPVPETLKVKRFYEHPTNRKHDGKQTSNNHGNGNLESHTNTPSTESIHTPAATTANSSHMTTPSLIAPNGSRLQKLEEELVLLAFNGSVWATKELGSMIVYQLCQMECMPSHQSQKESVLIDTNSLRFEDWNIYVSSSSFSSLREERENTTSISWSLESYIRKLIAPVGIN